MMLSYKKVQTVKDLLNYKNDVGLDYYNTPLHDAILNADLESLIHLLKLNQELPVEQSVLNKTSWGNTPLLLALKTGNEEAALLLLQEEHININLHDARGFQAIHWACIFRFNNVILKILEKQPEVSISKSGSCEGKLWRPNYYILRQITPAMLYQYNWPLLSELQVPQVENINDGSNFNGLVLSTSRFSQVLLEGHSGYSEQHAERLAKKFAERPEQWKDTFVSAYIVACMTDMLFHMHLIYQNIVIGSNINTVTQWERKEFSRTCDQFHSDFINVYPDLQPIRKSITVDPVINFQLMQLKLIDTPNEQSEQYNFFKAEETKVKNKNRLDRLEHIYGSNLETGKVPNEAQKLIEICSSLYNKLNLVIIAAEDNEIDSALKNIFRDQTVKCILEILKKLAETFQQYIKIINRYTGNKENIENLKNFCGLNADNLINFLRKDINIINENIKNLTNHKLNKELKFSHGWLNQLELTKNALETYRLELTQPQSAPSKSYNP